MEFAYNAIEFLWTVLVFLFTSFYELYNRLHQLILPQYKDISSDIVLITGGAGGLGKLLALEFALYCPKVVLLDRDASLFSETVKDIAYERAGCVFHTYTCDLRDRNEILETTKRIQTEVGTVSILINNAGLASMNLMWKLSEKEVEDCFKVNVLAHFHLVKAFLPGMIATESVLSCDGDCISQNVQPRGHIVTISSIAATISNVGMAHYCGSKAAALLASEALELDLAEQNLRHNIHVTRVLPYLMNTTMFQGCQSRTPWLTPTIDAAYCARRVVQAVRSNENVVYIYPRYYLLALLKLLLPTEVLLKLFAYTGVDQFMSQYRSTRGLSNHDQISSS